MPASIIEFTNCFKTEATIGYKQLFSQYRAEDFLFFSETMQIAKVQ
jgi:hypothetical protein